MAESRNRVILTGAIRSGKSTAVRAVLEQAGWTKPAGYFTHWGGAHVAGSNVYIETWAGEKQLMAHPLPVPPGPGRLPFALELERFMGGAPGHR